MVFGLVLIAIGLAVIVLIFNPNGLLIPFENQPFFLLVIFASAMTVGFGAWLLSGYSIKMFAGPALIVAVWAFLFVLPVLLLPLPGDASGLILSFSLLLLVMLYGKYSRRRQKRQSR